MKKFTLLFATLLACVLPIMSQEAVEPATIDSVAAVDGSDYVLLADPAALVSTPDSVVKDGAAVEDEAVALAGDSTLYANDSTLLANDSAWLAGDSSLFADEAALFADDSTWLANDTAFEAVENEFAGDDEIELRYVPNRFIDNWEINIAGGVSLLFTGLGHDETTAAPHIGKNGKEQYWDALGGRAEITATKWFNPYAALRIGWTTGYLPSFKSQEPAIKSKHPIGAFDNYVHVDALWDWTTQFGGYKPNRIYDAVPYLHVGVVANPAFNAAIGGGLGYLSRFHVAEHWLINLDLRATATTARKYGIASGIAIDVQALVGVTYRFNKVGWKKTVENPYKETLEELRAANAELDQKRAQMQEDNEKLEESVNQREQERKELAQLVAAITKDTTFYGVPDTMELTVYYAINSSELSQHEKAHMNTYLRLISLNDPNYIHMYKVIGTADAETGAKDVNERLCQRRAETIKKVLIENGVDPENITTEIDIVKGNAQMARASHVIIYPVEKPKVVIPDTVNLDVDDEE